MAIEFHPPESLEQIGAMQEGMQAACQALGLVGLAAEPVLAGGVAAWSALLLAGGRGFLLSLGRSASGVSLSLTCDLEGQATPPGLVPALFCPPAKGAVLRRQGRRAVFQITWEI